VVTNSESGEVQQRWEAWLLQRNRRGMRGLLWIGVAFYPLFGILDALIAPSEWLWLLWSTRAIVTAITLGMFWVVPSPLFERHPHALSSALVVIGSVGISMMTVFMGGLASPYYAGLALVIVASGLLFVWPPVVVVLTHASIVLSFLIPNLLLGHRGDLLSSISNQFFLVSTAVIAGTGQIVMYGAQHDQVDKQLILERTKKHLELAHAELKELDRFKSEFFANITHELKTPITMILAPLELMVDGQLGHVTEPQRSTLLSMQRSGVKLLRLIADLLDLSKLEESRLRLRIAEHDLVGYLREFLAQVEPMAQRKALSLRFSTTVPVCSVWCDIDRMERVFVNLLSNATKFTPARGTVSVNVVDRGATVRVDVSDTGIGFPPEKAGRLFQRFYQVDSSDTRRLGGTGIGLALAKELVELHGGQIWATGTAGAGATFSIELPKDREHFNAEVLDRRERVVERHDGQRAADLGIAEWRVNNEQFRLIDIDYATEQRVVDRDPDEADRPYTVLVVEDTPDVTRVIRLALHHEFRVLAAGDGLRGFELAKKHRPTLILTDLMMPELDGLELTRRLRADPATQHIPIVMLTARTEIEARVAGLESGVNAYLGKPFSAKELISVVRGQLASQTTAADKLLSRNVESIQTLSAGLAHEVKNPLNYIRSSLSSLRRDTDTLLAAINGQAAGVSDLAPLAARIERLFAASDAGVRRIMSTVDLLVRYSREGYTRAEQPYDVYAGMRDVLDVLRPSIGSDIDVSVELSGDGMVRCVPEELHQALTNLLENAMQAVPADGAGRIWVKGSRERAELVLSIRDNGPGIAPEDQAKIFTAFYTTKEVGRGMGLGLTITRSVITGLSGTIQVNSRVGAGTEFLIRLPALQRPASAAGSTPALSGVAR
jgi:signal transduction histidine kinase